MSAFNSVNIQNKLNYQNSTFSDENVLVAGLKLGEENAFAFLYNKYAGSLLGIIERLVKLRVLAEDVLQETFIKICRNIKQFDPLKGRLSTWMAKTAKNTALDHLKSKAETKARLCDDLSTFTVEIDRDQHWSFNTDILGLKNLTFLLSIKQQQLVYMIYYEGFSHAEAAKKLNIPLGTIKSRIRQAICILKRLFLEKRSA